MVQTEQFIEEIKKRPGLWDSTRTTERLEKLRLWKSVGEAIFPDWAAINKATAYDRVIQLQKKWRSLRDAYNRELRARRRKVRINKRVYMYFKPLSFLGGTEGLPEPRSQDEDDSEHDPLITTTHDCFKKEIKFNKRRRSPSTDYEVDSPPAPEMDTYPVQIEDPADDSDKQFLLSFLPEIKNLPPNLKMWVRAQIANIMQEAVSCNYSNTQPESMSSSREIKAYRASNDD